MFGKKRFWFTVLFIFAFFSFSAPSSSLSESLEKPLAFIIELEGAINPGTAMFVVRGLEKAREANATLAIIRLDTPGGLGSSMRTIIKAMLNSPIPMVVYVGPKGAGAASAGVMITEAADVAAMAKGTNIGAAHPVSTGGKDIESEMGKKVVNDMAAYAKGIAEEKGRNGEWVEKAIRESVSITADEALKKKVVDHGGGKHGRPSQETQRQENHHIRGDRNPQYGQALKRSCTSPGSGTRFSRPSAIPTSLTS